jgi:uncharacterized protein YlaI
MDPLKEGICCCVCGRWVGQTYGIHISRSEGKAITRYLCTNCNRRVSVKIEQDKYSLETTVQEGCRGLNSRVGALERRLGVIPLKEVLGLAHEGGAEDSRISAKKTTVSVVGWYWENRGYP